MFKEITDRESILELGAAGLLWDSWFLRDSDPSNDTCGEYIWDERQPITASEWNPLVYYLDYPDAHEEHSKYKFYVQMEE